MPVTEPPRRDKLALSGAQLGAAALTAVTVTVASTFLGSLGGTGGTLIAAVAGAVLSTAGAAFYAHWLRATRRGLANLHGRRVQASPLVLAAAVVGLLGIVLGGVTGVEAMTGRPLSALVGGEHYGGTTLGRVFGPPPSTPAPTVDPSTTSASPTPTLSPVLSPSPTPTETFPIFSPAPTSSAAPTGLVTPTDSTTPAPTASPTPSF